MQEYLLNNSQVNVTILTFVKLLTQIVEFMKQKTPHFNEGGVNTIKTAFINKS